MSERARIVMGMLNAAAERNDFCPSNSLIATAIGAASMSAGANIISFLEINGMIKVERSRKSRVVTIRETGKRTRGSIAKTINPACRTPSSAWNARRDAILMEAIANELDFEQAAKLIGCCPEQGAARFDYLRSTMGAQAA
ncbi:MAG: hypothetical protein A3E01_09345 [Gammaproteobacteria bacterium RIFCSPHIGHO2_12_FULL_63_22]|nr:MAG: hypothetical protein A3E01_09345 [Gammaproteobacteria bacterium RIFCSPHIGHO2_12_FULL_63_22]